VTRTLSGNLEDLDLDEIVRVIALSRRSGLLAVEGSDGKAELSFVAGRLVRARIQPAGNVQLETLADVLTRAGLLDTDDFKAPPGVSDGAETLDTIVARVALERGERELLVKVDDVIGEHLVEAAVRVMLYRTGSFQFRVAGEDAPPLRYPRDTAFTLAAGKDADELAREARKRRSERRADPLSAMHGRSSTNDSGLPRRAPNGDAVELFLVDDDPSFLQSAERAAVDAGVHVAILQSARAAIDRFFALGVRGSAASGGSGSNDTPAYMVVDLVMPRSTGKGILGGIEVLKRAAELDLAQRCFLAIDEPHPDAEQAARELGIAGIVKKPHGVHGKQLEARLGEEPPLAAYLNPVLERLRRAPLVAASFDLAKELRIELGDTTSDWRTDGGRIVDENVRSLETLKALLGELNEPSFDEEIPLLVLRFASAFFVRGALFLVDQKKGELTGLGGFGLGVADPGRLVHSIKIPVAADTVFTRALKEKAGVRQPFFDSEWNLRLTSALGGPRPRDVYTAPLTSPRGVEAVIYADNATDPRPFPDIHLLEIFLQQSAAAIERATLKNQLKRLMAATL
jgi:hypothetical protein